MDVAQSTIQAIYEKAEESAKATPELVGPLASNAKNQK